MLHSCAEAESAVAKCELGSARRRRSRGSNWRRLAKKVGTRAAKHLLRGAGPACSGPGRDPALQAFHQRWSGIVAVAGAKGACCLLACLALARTPWMAQRPPLLEVLAAARLGAAEEVSRLAATGRLRGPGAVTA